MLKLTDEQLKEKKLALEADLKKAKVGLKEAQEKVMKAQERLSFFIEFTQQHAEVEKRAQPHEKTTTLEMKFTKPTVADAAEELLREEGPLATSKLHRLLTDRGKIAETTTTNSLHMTLTKYRKKGERFDRNQAGQWILKKKQKDDSSFTQSRLLS